MKLYLVRHGRTKWNTDRLIQGRIDVPLCDVGIKDAKRNAKKLKDVKFDICYCSPLIRAKETANIIVDGRCDIVINDLITERDVGRFEGAPVSSIKARSFWTVNENMDVDGVENYFQLLARTKEFLELLKTMYSDETILIVSHSGTIKALHYNIIGYDDNTDFLDFYCGHDDILEYDI